MINTILAAGIFSCCISCNSGKLTKTENSSDTTLLSSLNKQVIMGNTPAVLSFIFSKNSRDLFNSSKKTWLLFDDAHVIEAPDGVYEIYLTSQPPEINNLTSTNPAFVNVLDLYSLTAPGAKQMTEVDISAHIKNMFLQKPAMQAVYLTIIFSGNRLANGGKSNKGGELRLSGIRMLQTKE